MIESQTLQGSHIRLEPLSLSHAAGLAAASTAASAVDPSLYRWSTVPAGEAAVTRYIETALALREEGKGLAFATVRLADGAVVGSTRFFDLETWSWPPDHPRHGRTLPDVCEIGYTWLTSSALRTGANTEAKLLMLTFAFETWQVLRVCLHTDARNHRSRAAIERIGGRFEGLLRAHRMAADFTARVSARYSIVAADWPDVKEGLMARLRPA